MSREGVPAEWREAIRVWAEAEPNIVAAYAFGSRAKGTHTCESDLDLAYELDFTDDDEALGFAICEAGRLHDQLQPHIPVVLDLDWMHRDDVVVWPAVREHGVELYRRAHEGGERP